MTTAKPFQEWIELRFELPAAAFDDLIERLTDLGFTGFVEQDRMTRAVESTDEQLEPVIPTDDDVPDSLLAYLPADSFTDELRKSVERVADDFEAEGFTERRFVEEDWNASWEATVRPVEIGERLVIAPSWHPYRGSGRIAIEIDPKMAFGTGYHETTRLVMRHLEQLVRPGQRVLDVGAGTGVLAIAALKLGAATAVGTDNDGWALDNARENAARNGVADRFEVSGAELNTLPAAGFDLVLANIQRDVLLGMMPDLRARLAPDATLVLSGLLAGQRDDLVRSLTDNGLTLAAHSAEGDWIALVAR